MIQHLCRPILWALLLSSLSVVASAQQLIRYNISLELADRKQSYYVDLLTLVLEKTVAEYGAYKLEPVVMEMSPGRATIMVEQDDGIDIIWRMTSVDLEQRLAPVYWPLLKGIMGYRIFIIRAERQHDFTPTMHREELKSLVAGQGTDWADAKILDKNGFSLIKSGTFRLLDMLDKGRFDYFPRALHEPWVEITNRPQFVVEKNILLKYVAPMFFFVRKDNLLLQQRLALGLEKAYRDGSFDALFFSHSITKDVLEKANLENRLLFELDNPLLSEQSRQAMKRIEHFKLTDMD